MPSDEPKKKPARPKKKRPSRGKVHSKQPALTPELIKEALEKSSGVAKAAARMLKVSAWTLHRHIGRDPELRAILAVIREETLDLAETSLTRLLKDPDHPAHPQAVFFTLRTLGSTRGFAERQEIVGAPNPDGSAGPVKVQFYLPEREVDG